MPFFSILRRQPVTDGRGRRARLVDLAIDLLGGDHPPIHRALVTTGDEIRALGPEAIRAARIEPSGLVVADLDLAEPADDGDAEIRLGRDVLDALVLDLEHRRATRANDLLVDGDEGALALRAADVGVRAIVRRLTLGRCVCEPREHDLYDWRYVEFLRGDASAVRPGAGTRLRIGRLPAGEIAGLASAVPYRHAAELLTLLPDPLAADALEAMEEQRQLQVFEELDEAQRRNLLALMAPDIAADLVGRLRPDDARTALELLPTARRERVIRLLKFPDDSVGGLMTDDVVAAPADWTVGEARERLRERLREPDFIYFVYVVADLKSMRLRGVVTLRDLLVVDESRTLGEVANDYLVALQPVEDARTAAFRVLESQLAALPVVGRDMRLLGALTVDAAVRTAAPARWRAQAPRVFS
jgi:magnesium transporter